MRRRRRSACAGWECRLPRARDYSRPCRRRDGPPRHRSVWECPAPQRAECVPGAGVGDTAVEDDVEIESAARRMAGREIEHKIAIENRRDLDAAVASRGEN